MYLNSSPVGLWVAGLVIRAMFRFNKLVMRSSLHGLGDGAEVQVFFDDLVNTWRRLGVAMPALSGFEPKIRAFAAQTK